MWRFEENVGLCLNSVGVIGQCWVHEGLLSQLGYTLFDQKCTIARRQ